jgi:hypothetical protein
MGRRMAAREKNPMSMAEVGRTAAMPKGLRHAFGVTAFQGSAPLSCATLARTRILETRATYADVAGEG